ncbi:FAD/NAD-P-binding domain-containing protein, partial [Trametes elegans]
MSKTKVIIAGAGIAGPVLAIFLQAKGYAPIIYERTKELTLHGLSLGWVVARTHRRLQPNGFNVLSLVPGLLDKIVGGELTVHHEYSVLSEDFGELKRSDDLGSLRAEGNFGILGVRRVDFHHTLVRHAEEAGVPIVFGHQLVSIAESDNDITVTFANGETDTGSFLVGCDGLHSNTRECLFGKQEPTFTGLVQTGGLSETPKDVVAPGHAMNVYGDGAHMIAYPVNSHQTSWAITTQEPEAKESWRAMDEAAQETFRTGPFSKWPFGVGQLVETGTKIVKYGLYDRPELQSWHKGRVVLLGDAAHPTSPHLGQGANQAFEDVYHLIRLLTKYNPDAGVPSTKLLSSLFTEFETLRIARTSALVRGAREQGRIRVVSGVEACKRRNEFIRTTEDHFSRAAFKAIVGYPFELGHSEV